MQVYKNQDELPLFNQAVITIGTFDGVHKGHQQILEYIVNTAKSIKGESVIITFFPHPRQVINPSVPVYYLTTLEEKLNLFQAFGVDNVIVVPFSRSFSEMSATAYAENFLIKQFNPTVIVFGYDHRFGNNREGDIHLLKSIASQYHVDVHEIAAEIIDDITVSSTKIRNFLQQGEVSHAAQLLGYPYRISGIVVTGDRIGRELGYPTANIHIDDATKLIPADGIYIVNVHTDMDLKPLSGMMSIGMRPTFEGKQKRIEVHIFDFAQTIYGDQLTVSFLQYLRPEKKYTSREDLIEAMKLDEIISRDFFAALNA